MAKKPYICSPNEHFLVFLFKKEPFFLVSEVETGSNSVTN